MADLPEKGTFKIETVGPKKEGTSKKGNPYRTYDLQFEGDSTWYNTFWTKKEDPEVGMELKGTKSYNDNYDNYSFEIEREGGKSNWNPAGANATVMLASVEVVNGFLSIGDHYDLWDKGAPELKAKFDKYLATIDSVAPRIKEKVVGMGSLAPEQKTAEKKSSGTGDPGPTPPPEIEGWPEGEEPQDI